MTLAEEIKQLVDQNLAPDDQDFMNRVLNDEEEQFGIDRLYAVNFDTAVRLIKNQLVAGGFDIAQDEGEIVTEAGFVAVRVMVALAYLAGIVSERQRNTDLLEQLGGP